MPELPKLPPIADAPLSVVLLARPGDPVADVLPVWLAFLDARAKDDELIVVDDGVNVGPSAEGNVAHDKTQPRIIRHEQPQGEGVALRAGLEAATRPLVFYTLCQPDYRPDDLNKMLTRTIVLEDGKSAIEIDHIHLMTGTRAGVKVPLWMRALNWLWRAFCFVLFSYSPRPVLGRLGIRRWFGSSLARICFGVSYRDPACPYRLMRRDILGRIPIQSKSAFAHVELIAKANFLECLMAEEIPLDVKPPAYRGDAKAFLRDARLVQGKPDFGPAVLPTQTVEVGPLPGPPASSA